MRTALPTVPRAVHVTDLELTRPLGVLEGLDQYASVRAVARVRDVPVTEVLVPVRDGRVEPAAVVEALAGMHAPELTRHLLGRWLARGTAADVPPGKIPDWAVLEATGDVGALAACPEPPEPPLPTATVAVCTRDRPDDLARCLTALAALDYPDVDVLVVDNAPRTGATEAVVREQFGASRDAFRHTFRYVREPRPGLNWARNRAVAEARGEVLAFTDDDVVVDAGWLRALGRVFGGSPATMAVTGMIAPTELETRAQRDFEAYSGFGHGWSRRWSYRPRRAGAPDYWHHGGGWLGTGANMAFRRAVFDTLGGFDPALDVGTVTQGGGDLEILFRLIQEGQLLVYAPDALVRHRHRRGADDLRRQLTTWGSGYHAFLRRSRRAYPEERRAFDKLAHWWWRSYVFGAVRTAVREPTSPSALRWYEVVGTVRGAGSYDRAARTAAELLARYPDEPTALPRPSAPRGPAPDLDRSEVRHVSIDAPLRARLDDVGDVARVQVVVTAGGRPVAQATAVPERGMVSVTQLRDVVAAALAGHLVGTRPADVRRSLAGWLAAGNGRPGGRE